MLCPVKTFTWPGDRITALTGRGFTVIAADALRPSLVAVIVAFPGSDRGHEPL
jgi:hypothetical protein